MRRNEAYSCPGCNTLNTAMLEQASLLICKKCSAIVGENEVDGKEISMTKVPEDWSFIQLGSTGEFQKHSFKIVGRIRLQLRNDYKNFWCAEYNNGKCLWIVESFASFLIIATPWASYEKDITKLRAGNSIPITSELKLTGEYVEKCEGVSYQGEIGPWRSFNPGFFVIQASDTNGKTAVFFIENKKVQFVLGEKVEVEKLNLKNIIEWNEWK